MGGRGRGRARCGGAERGTEGRPGGGQSARQRGEVTRRGGGCVHATYVSSHPSVRDFSDLSSCWDRRGGVARFRRFVEVRPWACAVVPSSARKEGAVPFAVPPRSNPTPWCPARRCGVSRAPVPSADEVNYDVNGAAERQEKVSLSLSLAYYPAPSP